MIEVSNPTSPAETGFYVTPGWSYGVYVSGNIAYVADGGGGLFTLRYTVEDVHKVFLPLIQRNQ